MQEAILRARPIMDLIARHESDPAAKKQNVKSGYDVVVTMAYKVLPPIRLLTEMTVNEVLAWQERAIKAYRAKSGSSIGFSAAGRYQILRATLQMLVKTKDARLTDLFDSETQDRLCLALLRQRQWDAFLSGGIDVTKMADNLAHEWASFPDSHGHSFYSDGINKALVDRDEVIATLLRCRGKLK